MFRNILFAMSLSGSVVVLLYLFFYPLAKRYFPLVWRYRVLKIAVFFYLVPVSRWKYRIFDLGRTLFPELWDKIYTGFPEHIQYCNGKWVDTMVIRRLRSCFSYYDMCDHLHFDLFWLHSERPKSEKGLSGRFGGGWKPEAVPYIPADTKGTAYQKTRQDSML